MIQQVVKIVALMSLLSFVACTGKNGELSVPSNSQAAAKPNQAGFPAACSPEMLAAFERTEGVLVDLEKEELPRGLYLASLAQVLIEKKSDQGTARLMMTEQIGQADPRAECAENPEALGPNLQTSISAVVKFDTTQSTQATGLTTRQFFAYVKQSGYGAVFSTPRNQQTTDIKQALLNSNAMAHIYKLSDRSYVIRYVRERDGVKTRLVTLLEFVPAP